MKKLLVLTFLFIFALQSVSLAAVSSSKGSSAPRSSTSITQKAPSTSQTSPNTSSGYKSSAPASSYSDKAPNAATTAKQQVQQQQSTGNSFLRSAAMFGGGMLMGSMLGNMFGFGSNGMFSEILGLLFNVLIVVLLFKAALYIWNRFRANRQ
jgi:predicted lipid-binding transport protein (Tim44 family)